MSELDLAALEREQEIIAKYPWWSAETPRADPAKVIALIQRLREAEAAIKAAEGDYDRQVFEIADLQSRITQLEGVAEAALVLNHALNEVLDTHHIVSRRATDALFHHAVALADVKEPSRA